MTGLVVMEAVLAVVEAVLAVVEVVEMGEVVIEKF